MSSASSPEPCPHPEPLAPSRRRDNTGMMIDEELSALMDRFFRAVSFDAGGTPAYERLHDLFTPAGRLVNPIGDAPDDATVAGFIEPRRALAGPGALTASGEG